MESEIQIEVKDVYGVETYYVVGAHAEPISALTHKKTINLADMEALVDLGFTFNFGRQIKDANVKQFLEKPSENTEKDVNPYLLSGDELERTEKARREARKW